MNLWTLILVAAGEGRRFGGSGKQFENLCGRPVWNWPLRLLPQIREHGLSEVVVVAPGGREDEFSRFFQTPGIQFTIATGGKTRSESVLSGLRAAKNEWSLIHDGARPLVSSDLCLRLMDSAESNGAAVPILSLNDALKVVDMGRIIGTCDRSKLHITQTPQAFPTRALLELLGKAGKTGSDEAEVWLNAGKPLAYVKGENTNFKITYPEDLRFAERIVCGNSAVRTGFGYDIHPLVPGRPLVIGGVKIPFPLGLSGHSDGDLLCHAVSDSLLGAAGFPDIGTLFPSSDQSFKNAYSLDLMKSVVKKMAGSGFYPRSVDAVINAQIPKLAPWIGKIETRLGEVLFPEGNGIVSVKAKSGERTGSIGNGEAIACWVVATICSESF